MQSSRGIVVRAATWVVAAFLASGFQFSTSAQESQRLTASDAFAMYSSMLAEISHASLDDFKTVIGLLERDGFRKASDNSWRFRNESGSVVVAAYPEQGSYFVSLAPKNTGPFGDAALAALIAKAEAVMLDSGGQSIEILLRRSNQQRLGKTVEVSEYIYVALNGAIWWRTSRAIVWR